MRRAVTKRSPQSFVLRSRSFTYCKAKATHIHRCTVSLRQRSPAGPPHAVHLPGSVLRPLPEAQVLHSRRQVATSAAEDPKDFL